MTRLDSLDRRAVLDGASVAAMIALPVQLIARIAVNEDRRTGWTVLLTLLIMGGLVLGAGVAAWRQERGTPLSHGIVTAVGVFLALQLVFTLVRIAQSQSIHWGRIVVSLGLSLLAGVFGGQLGSTLTRRGMRPAR